LSHSAKRQRIDWWMQPQPPDSAVSKAAILLAVLLAPASAFGQSDPPTVDLAIGYERLHDARTGGAFGPEIFVAIEGNYHEWLSVVGRFSGTTSSQPARFFGDSAAGTGAYVAGAKISLPKPHQVVPFVQMLAGIAQFGDRGYSYGAVVFQPGAGVDLSVHRHLKLRLAADRRWMAGIQGATGATASVKALTAGLVVH
jgi:hypothetical protein